MTEQTELYIDNSVGEIEFVRGDTQQMVVELTIKETDDGFFYGGGDIHAVKLVSDWSGNELSLAIKPDEDIQAHWRVTLPRVAGINVDMGVGEISGELFTTDGQFDLGVGELDLTLYGDDISRVSADAGIGETKITGFNGAEVETTRAMVSSESDASGQGRHRISIDVGVGEARVDVRGQR